jgi:hypothetical protein
MEFLEFVILNYLILAGILLCLGAFAHAYKKNILFLPGIILFLLFSTVNIAYQNSMQFRIFIDTTIFDKTPYFYVGNASHRAALPLPPSSETRFYPGHAITLSTTQEVLDYYSLYANNGISERIFDENDVEIRFIYQGFRISIRIKESENNVRWIDVEYLDFSDSSILARMVGESALYLQEKQESAFASWEYTTSKFGYDYYWDAVNQCFYLFENKDAPLTGDEPCLGVLAKLQDFFSLALDTSENMLTELSEILFAEFVWYTNEKEEIYCYEADVFSEGKQYCAVLYTASDKSFDGTSNIEFRLLTE